MAVTKLGGSEGAAWDKFMDGINHAVEASMELSIYTDNPAWGQISLLCKKLSDTARELKTARALRRPS